MNFAIIIFWLLVGHAVADYPLQGDFLAKAKCSSNPIPGIDWWIAMLAHSFIHAGAVAIVLLPFIGMRGAVMFGCLELAVHFVIDRLKCDGLTSFRTDQMIHVVCKIAWASAAVVWFLK